MYLQQFGFFQAILRWVMVSFMGLKATIRDGKKYVERREDVRGMFAEF